jgi:hypothetical protein
MAQRAESAADVTRLAVAFAHAMTVGPCRCGFYASTHPAVAIAVERPMRADTDACIGGMIKLAVTPHALLLGGMPLDSSDLAVVECDELLHDRDLDLSIMAR